MHTLSIGTLRQLRIALFVISILFVPPLCYPIVSAQMTPPNADAGKDFNTAVAIEAKFHGSGTDADGYITKYEWDFEGDGKYDTVSTTTGEDTWIYQGVGIYNAILRVTDNDGLTDTDTVKVTVVEGNKAPTADAGPDQKVHAMDVVTFVGIGKDTDGHVVKYEWDFDGDGKFDKSSTTNGTMTWIFTKEDTYYPVFKVTDDGAIPANTTDSCKVLVYPTNRPPIANPGTDITVHAKQTFRVLGKGTDVDGKITKYEWDFDSNGVIDRESPTTGEAIWSFDDPGTYKATFRVTDNAALPSSTSETIKIYVLPPNKAPTANAGTVVTATVETIVQFEGTGSDEDGTVVNYKWDFNGDGTWDWSSAEGGSTYCIYTKPGTFTARFMVTDDAGASANATKTVTIIAKKKEPAPPLIQFNLGFFLALFIGIGAGAAAGVGGAYGYLHASIAAKYKKVKELEAAHHADDEATFRGTQVGEREPPSFRGGDSF